MKRILLGSLVVSAFGIFVIDYFSHLLFSNPMETTSYFTGKFILFFIFSVIFLLFVSTTKKELVKVIIAGIVVASLWGMYYNVLPLVLNYSPYGIPLYGLTFLGMGLFGTGVAFGAVHTLAFVAGYYVARFMGLLKVN